MNQLKNILVGVDFSEAARCALAQAARLSQWNQAHLGILHVTDPAALETAGVELPPALDEVRRLHREQCIARLADWAAKANVPAGHSREIIHGPPLDVLLQESRFRRADLLVLGATGESLLSQGTGMLATKCLRKAPCKVMVIHGRQPHPFRRVLACVDFSELSREAVTQALRVANQDQAELHVLHVFEPEWQRWTLNGQLPSVAQFEQQYQRILEGNLRHFAAEVPESRARFAVRQAVSHAAGIIAHAREMDADLIVLGTKGRTNLKYVLLGSTVERLLKEIPCSVLAVRPPANGG